MVSNNFEEDLAVPSAESEAPRDEILPSSERAPADAGFPSAKTRAAAVAKVFVKCDDGQWRIASYHGSRRKLSQPPICSGSVTALWPASCCDWPWAGLPVQLRPPCLNQFGLLGRQRLRLAAATLRVRRAAT